MKIAIDNPYRLWELSQVKIGPEVSLEISDISIEAQAPRLERLISDSPELLAELRELLFEVVSRTSKCVSEIEDARLKLCLEQARD